MEDYYRHYDASLFRQTAGHRFVDMVLTEGAVSSFHSGAIEEKHISSFVQQVSFHYCDLAFTYLFRTKI